MSQRTGIQSMGELGRYFASGFKAKTAEGYLARLYRDDFTNEDISEGVERVIATRTQRTFPPYAEVLAKTTDSRADRLSAHRDHERQVRGPELWGTEAQKELAVAQFRELRAKMQRGEFVIEEHECPAALVDTAMPVRGVLKSSPAYRSDEWWTAHPNQPAGVTLRISKMQWLRWDQDRRPWEEAEATHAKLSSTPRPKHKTSPPTLERVGDVLF